MYTSSYHKTHMFYKAVCFFLNFKIMQIPSRNALPRLHSRFLLCFYFIAVLCPTPCVHVWLLLSSFLSCLAPCGGLLTDGLLWRRTANLRMFCRYISISISLSLLTDPFSPGQFFFWFLWSVFLRKRHVLCGIPSVLGNFGVPEFRRCSFALNWFSSLDERNLEQKCAWFGEHV